MQRQDYLQLRKQIDDEGGFILHTHIAVLVVMIEFALFSAAIYGLYFFNAFSWQFWVIEILLGISMFRCFVMVHECGHGTLFKDKLTNAIIGSLFGIIALVPYYCWRDVHHQHHKWVGVIDKDPTSVAALDAQQYSRSVRAVFRVLWVLRIPMAAAVGIISAFWCYPFRLLAKKEKGNKFFQALFSSALTLMPWAMLLTLLGPTTFFTYVGPALAVFYFWFEGINLCHHAGLYPYISDSHPNSIPCYQQEALCRTATLPTWLSIICCYHFNLHTEHHLFPKVPWTFLPRLSEMLEKHELEKYHKKPLPSLIAEIRSLDPFDDIIDKAPSRPEFKQATAD